MYSVHKSEAKVLDLKGRFVNVFIGSDKLTSDYMTVGLTEVHPMTEMDPHSHDDKEEIIYVISGHGSAKVGDSVEPLEADTAVVFPVGVPHSVKNEGRGPLKFVFMFTPPTDFTYAK